MEGIIIFKAIVMLVSSGFIAFRLTHDIVSGSPAGAEAYRDGILVGVNSYYGELDGFAGPFNAYRVFRRLMAHEKIRYWTEEGMSCRYCVSFGTSIVASVPLRFIVPEVFTLSSAIWAGLGIGGIIVFFFSWISYKSVLTSQGKIFTPGNMISSGNTFGANDF